MKIVDRWEPDAGSRYYTVEIADGQFVDVKYYIDDDGDWMMYVMDNEDGTQAYDDDGNTYEMSKAAQERVIEFVEGEIER